MPLKKNPKIKGIVPKRQQAKTVYARLFIDLPVKNNVLTVDLDAIERVTGEIKFVSLERDSQNDYISVPFCRMSEDVEEVKE